jgi:hypothetical protein
VKKVVELPPAAWEELLRAWKEDRLLLEGNLLKVLQAPEGDLPVQAYLEEAIRSDRERRERRLLITKQIQARNRELIAAGEVIASKTASLESALEGMRKTQEELEGALLAARRSEEEKEEALRSVEQKKREIEGDLDSLQRRTQYELMGKIVRVALLLTVGVGSTCTLLYAVALFVPGVADADRALLANTWSSLLGILLTNSFSIIGTIMGVKWASESSSPSGNQGE